MFAMDKSEIKIAKIMIKYSFWKYLKVEMWKGAICNKV